MKNNNQERNVETIKVKQELDWYIVFEYLESIRTFCPLFRDEKFCKMFKEMKDYVEEQIDVPNDIVDMYVVVEHTES